VVPGDDCCCGRLDDNEEDEEEVDGVDIGIVGYQCQRQKRNATLTGRMQKWLLLFRCCLACTQRIILGEINSELAMREECV